MAIVVRHARRALTASVVLRVPVVANANRTSAVMAIVAHRAAHVPALANASRGRTAAATAVRPAASVHAAVVLVPRAMPRVKIKTPVARPDDGGLDRRAD